MHRILITGCAGFIGMHAAQALAQAGHHVIGIDNFNTYYDPALKRERAKILKTDLIEILEGDIRDQSFLEDLLKNSKITHCLHLAAQAGVRYSLIAPQEYISNNIQGFISILEACKKFKEIKLIYASSSSVYGCRTNCPFRETDLTDSPASVYGTTKKTNELLASVYHSLYGITTIGLRFFTVYGPWGRPDMAYYTFSKAILEERPIELYNYGNLERDFTYVADIVKGIKGALDHPEGNAIYNLGNNRPVLLHYFVECLEKSLNKKAITQLLPMQPGDVWKTAADISLSKEKLGFEPSTPLEKGLDLFANWFLHRLSA